MPSVLSEALRKVRVVELAAQRSDQQQRAIEASGILMRAAVDAGWQVREVADAMGMKPPAASKRVLAARDLHPGPVRGLRVPGPPEPEPPERRVSPLDILRTPVDQRDWLTSQEAVRFTGLSLYGLRHWRRSGLLPNTRWLYPTRALYLRADLERVLAAPRYNNRGRSHAAVVASIRADEAPGHGTDSDMTSA